MKHPIPKLLSALLTLALLTALFPAASAATGTTPTMSLQETRTYPYTSNSTIEIPLTLMLYTDYAADKSLVLLGTERSPVTALYKGQEMIEVTPANYKLAGRQEGFTHTYAIVTDRATAVTFDDMEVNYIDSTLSQNAGNILSNLLHYDCDVDRSGGVDIRDAQTVAYILSGGMTTPTNENNMKAWLLADANASGKVDTADILAILSAAHR